MTLKKYHRRNCFSIKWFAAKTNMHTWSYFHPLIHWTFIDDGSSKFNTKCSTVLFFSSINGTQIVVIKVNSTVCPFKGFLNCRSMAYDIFQIFCMTFHFFHKSCYTNTCINTCMTQLIRENKRVKAKLIQRLHKYYKNWLFTMGLHIWTDFFVTTMHSRGATKFYHCFFFFIKLITGKG